MSCSLGPTGLTRALAQSRHPADIRGINELATRLDATHCSLRESGCVCVWGGPPAPVLPTPADLSPCFSAGPVNRSQVSSRPEVAVPTPAACQPQPGPPSTGADGEEHLG